MVGRLYGRPDGRYAVGVASRILVVEDDATAADVLREALEADGHEVILAEEGKLALDRLGDVAPDLIVLDLNLPDADGLVLCTQLRQRTDVPIVLCSGTPRRRDAVLGLRLGADDYVRKPVDVAELQARVQARLRRRGSAPSV